MSLETFFAGFDAPVKLQRVINSNGKVSVDGYYVEDTVLGRTMLELAIIDDRINGFVPGCPDCAATPPRCDAHCKVGGNDGK